MTPNMIQTVGKLTKKEILASVENETHSNYLVLETHLPFPGYHGETVPDLLEPLSLFALTSGKFSDEFIIRTVRLVKKQFDINFSATPGTIVFKNELTEVIRFKNLPYEKVGSVLQKFSEAGFGFKKARKVTPFSSIIHVRKFFKVEKIAARLFKDMYDEGTYYLQIPVFLNWDSFEKMTMDLKYNMTNNNFDAAQASVYYEKGVMDLVRIYDADADEKKLCYILEKYMEAINRL